MKTVGSLGDRDALKVALSHATPVMIIYGVFAVMLVVLGFIDPSFPSVWAITNLINSALPLIFVAAAQTIVVLIKGIDLSIGPAMALVMVIAATTMKDSAAGIAASVAVCLAAGLAIGALNGVFVVFARLQPIIVTLATSSILVGVSLYILPQPGGFIPESLGTAIGGALGVIPISAFVLAALIFLVWFPMRNSRIGQGWYAVGGNEGGAYYSGVGTTLAKFCAFLAAGLLAALGGLVLAAQTLTGDPMIGAPYTLNSIAATVLGGTSLAGGRGGVIGTIGGAFVLTIAVNVLFFFGVSAYYQYVFSGAIVVLALAAVSLSEYVKARREGKR